MGTGALVYVCVVTEGFAPQGKSVVVMLSSGTECSELNIFVVRKSVAEFEDDVIGSR